MEALMRKLVITLFLTITAVIYAATATVAQPYYSDNQLFSGFGPYADCNGQRCYVGPPYTYRRYHGHYYRVPGVYYYGANGGYFHGWSNN
jgi:hypothetical protein